MTHHSDEAFRATPVIRLSADGRLESGALPEASDGAGGPTLSELSVRYRRLLTHRMLARPFPMEFVGELGRGRQGVVLLALRRGARGCVTENAVKIFDPAIYRSVDEYGRDMSRMAYQVTQLHRVQSLYLATPHAYDEVDGVGFIQMDLIDGIDLRRILTGRHLAVARGVSSEGEWARFNSSLFRLEGEVVRLQPGVVVHIMRRVLRGLGRLHETGFLHCDVKPANIMLDRLGSIKLVDFGRATLANEPVSFLLGSPAYLAPELHRGVAPSVPSDLYSVGMVALEMLRGTLPEGLATVDAESLRGAKLRIHERLLELLPDHVRPNEALVGIMSQLLHPDPARRYRSARDSDVGRQGFSVIDRQLVRAGLHSEYGYDISDYVSKLVDPETDHVRVASGESAVSATS